MTAQQIVNDLILDNQNLVIEELMKHDECLWDELENFNEDTDVLEWWLVTPFMADMLKSNGEVILAAYDCSVIGGADRLPVKVSQWTG